MRDEREKLGALHAFTEHIIPGRWAELRPHTSNELKATMVLLLLLQEAAAKIRERNPVEDEEDYTLDVWAGVAPLHLTTGNLVADEKQKDGISIPTHVSTYKPG